jgi:hypothetical protein
MADHAHDAERPVADDQLAAERERGVRAHALVLQVVLRLLGPEAERVRGREDVREQRVLARLAGLVDHRLRDALAVVDHPLAHPEHDGGAVVEAGLAPRLLRRPRALDELADLIRVHVGEVRDRLARGRALDRERATVSASVVGDVRGLLLDGRHSGPFLVCGDEDSRRRAARPTRTARRAR